ncbi:hypothetical protein [Kitasatospora sp. LaBMicrA B282]|uniref:hypothetical protein n=1 Tax=Kitasatospora sp. LaBMicrA B282 TaxID=3420949 RepID=UPI003D0F1D76
MSDHQAPSADGSRPPGPAAEPATASGPAVGSWLRTRLRAGRAGALLLAVLVCGTAFLAAALPRTLDRDADRATTELLTSATPQARSLTASVPAVRVGRTPSDPPLTSYGTADSERVAATVEAELGPPLAAAPADNAYGTRTTHPRFLTDPGLPMPGGALPAMNLIDLAGQDSRIHLVAGRLPQSAHVPPAGVSGPGLPPPGAAPDPGFVGPDTFEVALAEPTAELLHVGVGSVLHTGLVQVPGTAGPPTGHRGEGAEAVVVGVFTADDPAAAAWSATPCVTGPCEEFTGEPPVPYWQVDALVGSGEQPALSNWGLDELFWQLPIDPHHLHAYQIGAAQRLLASVLDGPRAAQLPAAAGLPGLRLDSALPTLLAEVQQQRTAAAPLSAVGPLGAGTVALVVLLLAAGLAVDRRQAELVLLRARGGSLPGIGGRLLAETAVAVLPATALGTGLALLLPAPRWTTALLLGGLTGLLALLALPLWAVAVLRAGGLGHRRRRPAANAARRTRRVDRLGGTGRLVAEALALVLAAAAVLAVRRRGVAAPGSSVDLLLSAAPVLLAVAGAVLLARLRPLLLAPWVRWAARRPGALGFLGLARATRGTGRAGGADRTRRPPTLLPLLALLLAVATGGLGVTVLGTADADRQDAARQSIGGDAEVLASADQGTLPDGFAAAAARLPGVRAGVPVVVDPLATFETATGASVAGVLVIVDPTSYAALAGRTGDTTFDPAVLGGDGGAAGGAGAVPALISGNSVQTLSGGGDDQVQLPAGFGNLTFRPAASFGTTPAVPAYGERTVVVVSGAALVRQVPAAGPLVAAPTAWYAIGGGIRSADLLGLLGRQTQLTGPGAALQLATRFTVATGAELTARIGDNPLQHGTTRLFWTAVVAAAGYSGLALLLALLRAGPERAALLARLRTMGLRPGQGLALVLIESLPPVLLAAAAGAGLAWLTAPLLGTSVDLSAMVGMDALPGAGPLPGGLRVAIGAVLGVALLLTAVAVVVVTVEAAVAGRRQINTELRAGDQR